MKPEEKRLRGYFAALQPNDPSAAANLFSKDFPDFPGHNRDQADHPYERFTRYENGLRILQSADSAKFAFIHKGTPYYFMAWTAFDFQDYERAVFFMDAALSEDIRNGAQGWAGLPAAKFLFLQKAASRQAAQRIVGIIHDRFERAIAQFNNAFGEKLCVQQFVDRYVRPRATDSAHRSNVTALYSFVSEAGDREELLKLRSEAGGSIEAFVTHLFKGCLVFESLLKEAYPTLCHDELGKILKSPSVRSDLAFDPKLVDTTKVLRRTLQDVVSHFIPSLAKATPANRALALTYALRNSTAHSLLLPDVFDSWYRQLHEAITSAILFVITKKF